MLTFSFHSEKLDGHFCCMMHVHMYECNNATCTMQCAKKVVFILNVRVSERKKWRENLLVSWRCCFNLCFSCRVLVNLPGHLLHAGWVPDYLQSDFYGDVLQRKGALCIADVQHYNIYRPLAVIRMHIYIYIYVSFFLSFKLAHKQGLDLYVCT